MVQISKTTDFQNESNIWMTARYTYIPTSPQKVSGAAWGIRKKVWKFKDGEIETSKEVAEWTAATLIENFAMIDTYTFVCIPASDPVKNEMRYSDFAKSVCQKTKMANAFSHIKIEGERLAIHEHKICKSINKCQVIKFDKNYFNGRKVVIFDDVITKGNSFATFKDYLEKLGAEVVGGLFLAVTAQFSKE